TKGLNEITCLNLRFPTSISFSALLIGKPDDSTRRASQNSYFRSMAGVINVSHFPIFRTVTRKSVSAAGSRTSIPVIRASSSSPGTPPPGSSTTAATTTGREEESAAKFTAPTGFKTPEPKRFAVRPDKGMDIAGAALALFFRFGTGVFLDGYSVSFVDKDEIPSGQYALELFGKKVKETSKLGPRPEKPIEIYEFERYGRMNTKCLCFFPLYMDGGKRPANFSCPFCRKVREIVAVLDLDVLFYPCPRNGPNFRPKAIELGGKKQFPYMVDPNTGTAMYESDQIIKYLVDKYGNGEVPIMLSLGLLTTLTAGLAMIGRSGRLIHYCFNYLVNAIQGQSYRPSKLPPQPLEIWAYEGSPFCKLVREVLVELELPHIYRSCARGSPKRQILYDKTGTFQAPYLEDPNTGVQMYESAEIIEYLTATYAI
ncbi:hypothetical protein LINPERPRIM_LOCUS16304, partial [Linum perenne]